MFVSIYSEERWIPYQHGKPNVEGWAEGDLKCLIDEFGAKIHDQKFGPALLQQYFKESRVEPRRAVQEMDEWMNVPIFTKSMVYEATPWSELEVPC